MARTVYNLRVSAVGLYFNSLIEKLFYQPMLRDRLGLFGTARIYTLPAWLMNLIYTRTRPRGSLVRTLAISSIMAAIRMITWAAYQVAVILYRRPAAWRIGKRWTARRISMRCNSRGKGEAVLLIHGMPTNGHLWDDVVRDLSRHFRCIVIDLPGMGGTPFLPYSPSYFEQVAAQIEQLRMRYRVQRWHVVGHDGGCAIAVQYAHQFPKRVGCMALLSPAIFPDLKPFFLLELLRKPIFGELTAPLVHALFWQVAMRRAIPHAHNTSQRASFYKNLLRHCRSLETHAPRALGQARGCSSALPLDPQVRWIAPRSSFTVLAMFCRSHLLSGRSS